MNLEEFKNRVFPARNKLFRFALRILGNVEDAEDVVQEVFIKVWNRRHEMDKLLNIEAWCMKLVKNQSLDKVKSVHYKLKLNSHDEETPSQAKNPQSQTELNDTINKVHACIETLPQKQKQIIQLRDIEGHSYKEIADILSLDMNQVKVNLFRARQTIKEQIIKAEAYER